MSWLVPDWAYKIMTGVDPGEIEATDKQTDAQLAALNRQRLDSGAWDDATFTQAEAHRISSRQDDVAGQIDQAFVEGAQEGAAALTSGVKNTLSATVGGLLGSIPISLWVLATVALFFWMGGAALLKGRLAK